MFWDTTKPVNLHALLINLNSSNTYVQGLQSDQNTELGTMVLVAHAKTILIHPLQN